ncbi:MAG: HAD-IIIA family hydrolase [Desulfomicrobium sp.]|nr:HAD-IIIA family hydrolase [Desulfomicrobium sp.]
MTDIDTILLDRDGTLIEERHYLSDPALVALIPGAAAPMRRLIELGCGFYLASNQSGIGRGFFDADDYRRVHARLEELLLAEGVALGGAAFCPHAPEDGCDCRKPRTGMWLKLAASFGLRPEKTVMVGDKVADIRFGHAVGCAETVLVLTGHGREAAAKLGLPLLEETVRRCAPGPDNPTWLARDLGSFLSLLVQKKEHVHAHRI